MIIAKIKQSGQVITLEDKLTTFQYSANLQMQFVKDARYKDYILTGWYRCFKDKEYMLDINEDGIFTLGKDIFAKEGSVYFSFSLNNPTDGEIIHLGVIEYNIEQSFGSGDAILPEEQDTWIQVVTKVTNAKMAELWDKDYKPQLEENLNIIEAKTSEINRTAAEVKKDALESSANAKSALDSANLAKNSADNATLAKEKALEYSTNAEKSKNDASNYASQADLAKTEAQKSATDANNSASSALDSSNKAQQHLNSIVEKTNTFNADYASKVEDFNTNVENANNTLDVKISTANTDMDKKIADANNALDTKITDANTSMDAKVTVATEQADIASSKATELSQAVDKVKYLEDVVDTKLTQPYVSSPVIENATISDSDEGLLRNLKIYGKCTQKIEENIVPTPSRPVPIVSKKINVNGEIVELRSLKESANLFDYRVIKEKGLYTSSGSYISYAFKVKPNTNYYITKKAKTIPETTPDVFIGGDQNQPNGMYLFRDENVFKTTSQVSTADGYIYFKVNSSHWDNFVANIDNVEITITESTSPPPSSYIAPAVRDYKIVDHANKKAWIERNIAVAKNNNNKNFNDYTETTHRVIFGFNNRKPLAKVGAPNVICNIATPSPLAFDLKDVLWETGNTYLYWYPNIYSLGLSGAETKEVASAKLNEFLATTPMLIQYELATPVIEEIPYIESDISEFGSSSQDSTSPSPNIKSEIEKVDVLNIRACGKNMFNPQNLSGGEIVKFNGIDCYKYIDKNSNFIFDFSHNMQAKQFTFTTRIFREDGVSNGTYMYFAYGDGSKETIQLNNVNTVYSFKSNANKVLKQIIGNYNYAKICYIDLTVTQLEVGEVATTYEPYQETVINHTLSEPLVKCGEITDVINLNNLTRTNNNYFGLLDLLNQGLTYGGLVGNYQSRYWRASTMPKPKLLKENGDINNLLCSRFVSNLECYGRGIGETISIYKDSSADFIAVFNVNRFKDLEEFKQFFVDNPTMVAYPLATPTVEPLEPELVEKLKTLMSSYPITHIFSNVPLEFDYKLNMPAWHKVVSGQVEDARNVIYNMQVQQNNLEVMQLQSALETQYNMDLLKLGGM